MLAVLCMVCSAFFTAAFVVASGQLAWRLLHRNWGFVELMLPAGVALVGALLLACAGQVLGLMTRVAEDLWHLRRTLMDGSTGACGRAERPDDCDSGPDAGDNEQ
jgi:hypothetical protein